jgi:hypothetical protein
VGLDTGIPPRRLGRALRRARRELRLRRPDAATRLGISDALLAAWERGVERVPHEYAVALVDLYGNHLTARVPDRDPARIDLDQLVVGGEVRILASHATDDVLASFVEVVRGLRNTPPGAPLPLRTSDLVALAAALGTDAGDIEARIVQALRCSPAEAALVHHEMRRRRILVPAAGLALGAVAITGAALHAAAATEPTEAPQVVVGHAPAVRTTTSTTVAPATTSTTAAPVTTTTTAAPAPAPTTSTTEAPVTTPPRTAAPAPTTTSTSDDPPVSIPPGENPTILSP